MSRQTVSDYVPVIIISLGILAVIGTAAVSIYSMYECGWSSFLYGKNVFWAWMWGYCSG